MDDTPETIRQQMEETKSQLSEKLVSLESQVTETVQSTGTAVNATVEAVQETVETVAEAVQDAVHSVSNAFDLRRQIERHPWLVLGGATVLGYLAVEFFSGMTKKAASTQRTAAPSAPSSRSMRDQSGMPEVESATTSAAIAAAYESGLESSSRHQLQDLAIRSLIGIAQQVASQSVPHLVDYLTGKLATDRILPPEEIDELRSDSAPKESRETAQRFRIASSEGSRSGRSS